MPSLLLIALLAAAAAVIVWLHGRRGRVLEACCRRCGYLVTGLPTNICPECGSNLAGGGTLQQGQRRPLSPIQRILIWSLLLPLPAVVITLRAEPFAPRLSTTYESLSLTLPHSRNYSEVMIGAYREGYGSWRQFKFMEVSFTKESSNGRLVVTVFMVNVHGANYWYVLTPNVNSAFQASVDLVSVSKCMEGAGIDTGNSAVRREAAAVVETMLSAQAGKPLAARVEGFEGTSLTTGTAMSGRPAWVFWSALVFWLIVWLIGAAILRATSPSRGARRQR